MIVYVPVELVTGNSNWTFTGGWKAMKYQKLTQDQIDAIPDSIEISDEGAQKLAVGVLSLAVFYAGQARLNEQSVTLPCIMSDGILAPLGGAATQHIEDPTKGNATLAGIKRDAATYNEAIDSGRDVVLNRLVGGARDMVVFALNYANAAKLIASNPEKMSEPVQLPDELKQAYGPFQE